MFEHEAWSMSMDVNVMHNENVIRNDDETSMQNHKLKLWKRE
jgi:hypothetical protein